MTDKEKANPLQVEDTTSIERKFRSDLIKLIQQYDDGTYFVGSTIIHVLPELYEELEPSISDRGMSEIGM